ncbi:MAG: hypothetical protein AAGE84_12230 [Cyanobacteria bacterium P01_G01_bin.39]
MEQQISFVKGAVFHQEEVSLVEFKEITSPQPVRPIVNYVEEYVVGYLNAQLEGDLVIYT